VLVSEDCTVCAIFERKEGRLRVDQIFDFAPRPAVFTSSL
jgi:hypothetical protein